MPSGRRGWLFATVLIGCIVGGLILAALSQAQAPGIGAACTGDGVLDNVLCKYSRAASGWSGAIQRAAEWLFWTLATISMVWTFSMHALRRGDILEVLAELLRFTMFVGFFYYLLQNGTYIGETLLDSLRKLASQAAGVPNAIKPSGIIDVGLEIVFHIISRASMLSLLDGIFGFAMGGFILVVLATVAVDMLQLLVAAWFLLYAGIFFLGFGGSKWTSDMAIGYFRAVLSIAVQSFAMIMLVGVGKTVIDEAYQAANDENFLYTLGVLVVVAYAIYRLTSRIPPLLGGLVTGTHAAHAAGAGATLDHATAVGTSAAGAAFAVGGTVITAGVAQAAGMVEAYRAATGVARAETKAAGGEAGSVGAGVGPLASAFGDPARRGTGAGGATAGTTSSPKPRAATSVSDAQQARDQAGGGKPASQEANAGAARGGRAAKPESSGAAAGSAVDAHNTPPSADARSTRPSAGANGARDHADAHSTRHSADASDPAAAATQPDVGKEDGASEAAAQSTAMATDVTDTSQDDSGAPDDEEGAAMHELASSAATGVAEGDADAGARAGAAGAGSRGAQSTSPTAASGQQQAGAAASGTAQVPAEGGAPQPAAVQGGSATGGAAGKAASTAAAAGSPAAPQASGGDAAAGPSGASTAAASAEAAAVGDAQLGAADAQSSTAATTAPPAVGDGGDATATATSPATATGGVAASGNGSHASTAAAPHHSSDSPAMRTAIRAGEIFAQAARKQAQQAAHDAFQNVRARAAARIANTAGGRLAQSIRQSQHSPSEPPAAGEVDAFRDGSGSIGAPAAGISEPDAQSGTGRGRASIADPSGLASAQDPLFDPPLSSDESSGPSSETRGGHQPTGVREEEDDAGE